MAYWRYRLTSPITEEDIEAVKAIPGAKVVGSTVAVPEHGAALISPLLQARGLTFGTSKPAPRPKKDARKAAPWLREWVPAFLTPYQREGVMSVLNMDQESGILFWPAGAGKSLGAIVWALSAGPGITVVVTKAAVRGTWAREIDTYTQGVEWRILESRSAAAVADLPTDRPVILVTAYDTLPQWIETIEKLPIRSAVFDESHKAKNPHRWNANLDAGDLGKNGPEPVPEGFEPAVRFSLKDNRAAASYRLSRLARRRLATTATPIADRLRDLWAQLDLVHPWQWGSYRVWATRYCAATEGVYGGLDDKGTSNLIELRDRLAWVVHRVPFAVANRQLPPKRRLVTWVKVTEQVRAEGFGDEIRHAMRGEKSTGEARARLREVLLMEAAARKRKIVVAHVADAVAGKLKVAVFTGRRKDCERLHHDIEKAVGGDVLIVHGDGGTPLGDPRDPAPETRYGMLDRYMKSPGPAVLIGTGDAWGEGLNIQDTDLAIFAMLPYTPRQIIQWEGRFVRLGMKRACLIRFLICESTIDEHVATLLLNKLPAVERATESDEIAGLGRELIGESEESLLTSMAEKVLRARPGAAKSPGPDPDPGTSTDSDRYRVSHTVKSQDESQAPERGGSCS